MDRTTDTRPVWVYVQAWAGILLGTVAAAVSMKANSAIMTGDCQAQGLSPLVSAALIMLPLIGGLISYRFSRAEKQSIWLGVIARIGAEYALFVIALILMHLGYVTFFWHCRA